MTMPRGKPRSPVHTYAARVNSGKAVHIFTVGSKIPWCTAGTAVKRENWGRERVIRPAEEMANCKRCLGMLIKG